MKVKSARVLRGWLRDMCFGAILFLLMPVATLMIAPPEAGWSGSGALAGEMIAAGELATPANREPEPAGLALRRAPAGAQPTVRDVMATTVLGLTFSLLVAFNLAFLRHLRRVSASPRRDAWRRRR